MSLSVIIPSKTASNLLPCLEAVHKHEPAARLLVVDDGIDWQEARECRREGFEQLWASLELYCAAKPFVYARNCNVGINMAGSDDVVLLNDDALLQTPGGFTAIQRAAEEHPEYGLIASTCNNVGNPNQWPQGAGLRADPRMVCFVCVLIPRRTIETVGLLDEEFTGYGFEDDSYCLRTRRAGLQIGIFDGCYVDHGSLTSTFRGGHYPMADLAHNSRVFRDKYGASNLEL